MAPYLVAIRQVVTFLSIALQKNLNEENSTFDFIFWIFYC